MRDRIRVSGPNAAVGWVNTGGYRPHLLPTFARGAHQDTTAHAAAEKEAHR